MMITRIYKPAVDAGNNFPTNRPTTVRSKTIQLTYPYNAPTIALEVRAPELQNPREIVQNRVLRQSRNGSLLCVRDSIWPKFTRLSYQIVALSRFDASNVKNFVQQSLGREIGLLDYDSQQWRGFLISPASNEIMQQGRDCQWSTKLVFEGQLVGSYLNNQVIIDDIAFVDSVSGLGTRVINESITDSIVLVSTSSNLKISTDTNSDTISFAQSVLLHNEHLSDTISFGQVITNIRIRAINVGDTIGFGQGTS